MKKISMLTLVLLIFSTAIAQELDNDIIQINYEKKSPAKAMLLSSLFPGAGQFYANRRSVTTYISPLIEIGLIVGYIMSYNEGLDAESDYEKFADSHYDRTKQYFAQHDLIIDPMNNSNFYNEHFRLDGIDLDDEGNLIDIWDNNTQHFYEDIGKYNKYVFGWDDWFDIYATDEDGSTISPDWVWEESNDGKNLWIGNNVTNPTSSFYNSNYSDPYTVYSENRAEYIEMRKDTEDLYNRSELFSFGLVANHILAAIDAVRLTKLHNREYLSNTSQLEIKLTPIFVNNNLSPALILTKRF